MTSDHVSKESGKLVLKLEAAVLPRLAYSAPGTCFCYSRLPKSPSTTRCPQLNSPISPYLIEDSSIWDVPRWLVEIQQYDGDPLTGQSLTQPESKVSGPSGDQHHSRPPEALLGTLQPGGDRAVGTVAQGAHGSVGSVSDRGGRAVKCVGLPVTASGRVQETRTGQLLHLTQWPVLLHNAQQG